MQKITIEIWSDIVCPFCYIGKRHLEKALEKFPQHEHVSIEWKAYLLDPELTDTKGKNVYQYLADRKGVSLEESKQMHARVISMAASAGLTYDFDRAIISNTINAHRLSHFAASKGKQDIAEEKLFSAYFCEGKNISDHETLAEIAASCGLDKAETSAMLNSNAWNEEVQHDLQEAYEIGVRGVPFFVFNRKFAVSGAQPVEVFRQALDKAAGDLQIIASEGPSCAPGEDCD